VFAALNSIEPMVQELAAIDSFHRGQGWTTERRPQVESSVRQRLSHLAEWMGDKPYLEERFTAGDLMMVSVLRIARHTDLVDEFPVLKSYVERCTGRPAFERALAAQLAPIEATYAQIKGERA
jgi:glutathione S-transferase